MSNGTILRNWSIPSAPYTDESRYLPSLTWVPGAGGASNNVGYYTSKSWSGADRSPPLSSLATSRGYKRYYTVPVYATSRSGKKYTKLVTRSFWVGVPRKRARSGRDGEHAYTVTWQRDVLPVGGTVYGDSYSAGSVYYQVRYNNSSYRQWNSAGNIPTAVFGANDQIKILNDLRESLLGGEFNLSVFLGEGHQTLHLIGSSATKIAKAYTAARKGNFVKARNILVHGTPRQGQSYRKAAGKSWLELQYGWMPLLKDMEEGAKQLANYLHAPFQQRHRARRTVRVTPAQFAASRPYVCTFGSEKSLFRRQYIAIVSEPPNIAQFSGILDPELVLWELTPFSFVVDWFLPVGDYLAARALTQSKLIRSFIATDTIIRERKDLKTVVQFPGPSQTIYYGGSGGYESSGSSTRTYNVNAPDVMFPKFKTLEKALSLRHCLNGIALLSQAVGRH